MTINMTRILYDVTEFNVIFYVSSAATVSLNQTRHKEMMTAPPLECDSLVELIESNLNYTYGRKMGNSI